MHKSDQDLPDVIESALAKLLPQRRHGGVAQLDSALYDAVFPGGKRLRPTLTMLAANIFDQEVADALPAACAVEFVHTSSLIFDDLPCMDDATIRRGRPVLHRVYGEEFALLAGIALLNQAYSIFGQKATLLREATECIGVEGMIGGQALDLSPHAVEPQSLAGRNRKTSAMMRLALTAGALACGVAESDVAPLALAGRCLGEAYQMGDDFLDARKTSMQTGKTAAQDRRHGRPSHSGLDEPTCARQLHDLVERARESLGTAYGPMRVRRLQTFLDEIFTSLTTLSAL